MFKETLILSGPDIERLIPMPAALRIAEQAFTAYGQGKIQMPSKIYLHLDKYRGDFRAMPAYIEGLEACGIKWVNVHPRNKRYGLPTVMALIILSDPKTGFPLAVMDGTWITNLRTGSAGGVAAKYLANKDSKVVSLIGCGAQAQTQLMALKELFKIIQVRIYDRVDSQAITFRKKMGYLGLTMKNCLSVKDCLKDSDIAVTTTPSRKPIVKSAWVKEGAHINAIGADAQGKQELDPALLKKAKIVIDDITQALHSGEINVPLAEKTITQKDIHANLGDILSGAKPGRVSKREITVFDSTGLAILDVAMAHYAYRQARKNRSGKMVKFY